MTPKQLAKTGNALIACFAITHVVFAAWPQIDIWLSSQFYSGNAGFWLNDVEFLKFVRRSIWNLTILVLLLALFLWPRTLIKGPVDDIPARVWAFIVWLYLLGPGLLVNGIFKAYWGRARPADLELFGGDKTFSPAFNMADQCEGNCSFMSGEGSGVTALLISTFVITGYVRHRALRTGLRIMAVLITLTGLFLRVAKGRHFVSDTLFSVLVVSLVAVALPLFHHYAGEFLSRRGVTWDKVGRIVLPPLRYAWQVLVPVALWIWSGVVWIARRIWRRVSETCLQIVGHFAGTKAWPRSALFDRIGEAAAKVRAILWGRAITGANFVIRLAHRGAQVFCDMLAAAGQVLDFLRMPLRRFGTDVTAVLAALRDAIRQIQAK